MIELVDKFSKFCHHFQIFWWFFSLFDSFSADILPPKQLKRLFLRTHQLKHSAQAMTAEYHLAPYMHYRLFLEEKGNIFQGTGHRKLMLGINYCTSNAPHPWNCIYNQPTHTFWIKPLKLHNEFVWNIFCKWVFDLCPKRLFSVLNIFI